MAQILIVDDDPLIRTLLRRFLSKAGHICAEAEEGAAAVAQLERMSFDIALVDILMPVREGVETIGEIRRRWPEVRIIAMSGGSARLPSATLLSLATGMGAHQVVSKPIDESLAQLLVEQQIRLAAEARHPDPDASRSI